MGCVLIASLSLKTSVITHEPLIAIRCSQFQGSDYSLMFTEKINE